jgi:SSS family transporter
MTTIDYVVIGVYLVFMLALGPVYQRFSSTASDYFRGGGGMLWWMVGASAWVMTFTAWTFTGGAGKAYETGTFFLLLGGANFCGLVFTYFLTAARFRQMRVVTVVEAVRKRFGRRNEQFFTWLPVPFGILFGGIGLYAIGIFMSVVFGVSIPTVIIGLGVVVTLMAMAGGSFAVVASDFVQMLTILVITLVVAVLALWHPEVGRLTGLIERAPAEHFDWTEFNRPWVIVVFIIGLLVSQTVMPNSLNEGAQKFIYVKTGSDAKRALLISMAGTLIITPIFIIPAMAARIVVPDLAEQYPGLNNPSEAAYVVMAMQLLPAGMLGLLVCGIFAATMSSMDTGLNRAAGILVRNFYLPVINPQASESRQIVLGKGLTLLLGTTQIVTGLIFAQYQSLPLFDLILLLSAVVGLPTAVPLFIGIFVKRTPPWAAWSTVLVGLAMFLLLHGLPLLNWAGLTHPSTLQQMAQWWGFTPLEVSETGDLRVALTTLINFSVCLLWFVGTMPFWPGSSPAYREQVEAFFVEMNTPVDPVAENIPGWAEDRRQYHRMGVLCMAYGGFILALALLPNPRWGRLCFVFCGGTIGGLGWVLYRISQRREPRLVAADDPAIQNQGPN